MSWICGNVVRDYIDNHGYRRITLRNGREYVFTWNATPFGRRPTTGAVDGRVRGGKKWTGSKPARN